MDLPGRPAISDRFSPPSPKSEIYRKAIVPILTPAVTFVLLLLISLLPKEDMLALFVAFTPVLSHCIVV